MSTDAGSAAWLVEDAALGGIPGAGMAMVYVWLGFFFAVGCCVGSFLNVVILRIPEGRSVVHPPSHDPATGRRLSWWENVPIVSYVLLRGRDRVTRAPISMQYPLIELATGLLFAGLFYVYYLTPMRGNLMYVAVGDAAAALRMTWPLFLVHCVLLAALLAATVIDARFFIIPLQIPWFATGAALVVLPLAAWLHLPGGVSPLLVTIRGLVPRGHWMELGAGCGAAAGLAGALALLYLRILPRSFDEVEEALENMQPPDAARDMAAAPGNDEAGDGSASGGPQAALSGPEQWLAHPHPRREVMKELAFLALPILGAAVGVWLMMGWQPQPMPNRFLPVLAGVMFGYFVGAALVWGVRILGTLAFGKEAMGLGDVHLVGAIGACLGAPSAVLAFFIAPFLGLIGAALMFGASAILKERWRPIPYGPYLAAGALIVMVFHDPIRHFLGV